MNPDKVNFHATVYFELEKRRDLQNASVSYRTGKEGGDASTDGFWLTVSIRQAGQTQWTTVVHSAFIQNPDPELLVMAFQFGLKLIPAPIFADWLEERESAIVNAMFQFEEPYSKQQSLTAILADLRKFPT